MAATHGLDEQAEQIKESLDDNVIDLFEEIVVECSFRYRMLILMRN